jgi:hypothetical protein
MPGFRRQFRHCRLRKGLLSLSRSGSNRRQARSALVQFEVGQNETNQLLVDVVAAKVRVAVCGEYFKDPVAQLED